ncbi:hypothetical protein KY320_03295 [Candidatus Woesearchaeota archaeon]|nr:hypothetical protein [Candidatus Woesearchaeota archaeon]
MEPTIKEDLINILAKALEIINQGNFFELKELSNHTIHNASIFQDEYSVSIAVIMYALSKILERGKPKLDTINSLMKDAVQVLSKDDWDSYKAITKEMFKFIADIDSRLKLFIDEVVRQAEIKKSSKIYYHGISLGQAASILGVSQWELMNYVGHTKMMDEGYERPDVVEKVKFTRSLFK